MASQVISDGSHGSDPGKKDPKDWKDPKGLHKSGAVPCDANELIAAILLANRNNGATLNLAKNCTYVLTANQDGSGLPTITQKIILRGSNTTIERSANGANFRIFTVGAGGDLELSDLTIKGGRTDLSDGGGGVSVQAGGELDVVGSKFVYNQSINNQSINDSGGAIVNRGVTEIKQSTFDSNSAVVSGGAVANIGGQLTIEDTKLKHNSAVSLGGAVYSDSVVTLKKVEVDENTANTGGGLYVSGSGTIVKSSITNNHVLDSGGGLNVASGSNVVVRDSRITGNTAIAFGGGVRNGGNLVVEDSKIIRNQVQGAGGGVYNTGILTMRRSEVIANSAYGLNGQGGGIFNSLGQVTLVDTEVADNTATIAPGGLYSNDSGIILTGSSVIINNRPSNCTGSTVTIPGCFG